MHNKVILLKEWNSNKERKVINSQKTLSTFGIGSIFLDLTIIPDKRNKEKNKNNNVALLPKIIELQLIVIHLEMEY